MGFPTCGFLWLWLWDFEAAGDDNTNLFWIKGDKQADGWKVTIISCCLRSWLWFC
ncbi:MAG: hypothetical protein GFH27_549293n11 [Chloroflexi bacterium AL-W]|nr:hypothetical protein [Chloroflexi bacterium AL-N1]NOK67874.1 hypothetical protein [Chloroflexi bacterium AL-N10]NOK75356.1 hypothetical protein [Chloroflexi bacterium AL-N5]NOK82144.1 hypothetical protein [Chloroflexi bacterium AL-W]NOK89989.1 hypothetical protein [Chloroflexi bacterium AL-N15]